MAVIHKDVLLRLLSYHDLTLCLFANDVPADSPESAFVELSGHGYQRKMIRYQDWLVEDQAMELVEALVWEFTGGIGPIYGWYLTWGASLVAAERFEDGPYVVRVAKSKIKLSVTLEIG